MQQFLKKANYSIKRPKQILFKINIMFKVKQNKEMLKKIGREIRIF